MTKVHGKRYAYKFDFHGLMAACQQQAQGGDPTANMLSAANYKYHHHHHHHHSLSCDLNCQSQSTSTHQPSPMYSSVPPPLLIASTSSTSIPTTTTTALLNTTSQPIGQTQATISSNVVKPAPTTPTTTLFAPPYSTSYWPY